MPALLKDCRELFNTDNLYSVLGVSKEATSDELKRGYHKLSLKVHPDRVNEVEKDGATQKFQTLGKVYAILTDKHKRDAYDETGEVDDEDDAISQDRDWFEYWRILYAKVSVKDIEEFEQKYKGSDEELDDLKSAYLEFEGDMDEILDNVMCATVEDEDRFREILNKLIKKKELPKYGSFTKEHKAKQQGRKKQAAAEAAEAAEYRKELGIDDEASLRNLIMKRNQDRGQEADSFFAQLEAKYAQPKKAKKKTK